MIYSYLQMEYFVHSVEHGTYAVVDCGRSRFPESYPHLFEYSSAHTTSPLS
jgi:hypothetical protein